MIITIYICDSCQKAGMANQSDPSQVWSLRGWEIDGPDDVYCPECNREKPPPEAFLLPRDQQ